MAVAVSAAAARGAQAFPGDPSRDRRAIAEEIWPFTQGRASTPIGQAETAWRARHQAMAA